jgi:hypothetical protein
VFLAFLVGSPAWCGDVLLESDVYEEGEEVVGVFLGPPHYAVMVEDIERNGQTMDWGWVRTPAGPSPEDPLAAVDPANQRGWRKIVKRGSRAMGLVDKPRQLGFNWASYRTIAVAPLANYAGLLTDEEVAALREPFVMLGTQLGFEVVENPAEADLLLGVALVDISRDARTVPFPVAIRIEPSLTLELQILERATQSDLVLIRNRAHSTDIQAAALRYANLLLMFLR